jgi:cell division septal protein FtsQ
VDPRVRARWIAARRAEGRRRLRILLAVVGVVAVLALAWGVTISPLFAVDDIEVRGADHAGAEAVLAAAGVGHGDSMVWLHPGEVAARVRASPWIDHVSIRRDWPRKLVIDVTERTAAAWVPARAPGAALLVDHTGRVLQRVDAPPAGLPELVDVHGAPAPGSAVVPAAGARVAAAYGDAAAGVRTIAVKDAAVVVTLFAGPEVRLGSPTRLAVKLRAAGAVLDSRKGALPRYVDVSVPTNPVAG